MMKSPVDNLICSFDRALRTLSGNQPAARRNPAEEIPDIELEDSERTHAAGLMRVNHCGEICAQALYEGQALTARDPATKTHLLDAAGEERDHLAWCRTRLDELDTRPSVLDPLFYASSFALGAATGLAGDRISMGFVEATEDQVVGHLNRHLDELPEADQRSRAILETMRQEEEKHGAEALASGGQEFPAPVKAAMRLLSTVMTATTYRI